MNIVMVSNYSRPEIVKQSMLSLMHNASDWSKHHFTLVWNGLPKTMTSVSIVGEGDNATTIMVGNVGASRARNIGASSIPKYLRHDKVMFVDDDIYVVKGYDDWIEHLSNFYEPAVRPIYSLHAHPYNHTVLKDSRDYYETNVISTVCMAMPWDVWDAIGFFQEPGGAGGSEDVDYCARASKLACPLVISKPQYLLHTGVHSSNGTPIVGAELVMERNRELERVHGIVGKVRYA